MKTKAKGLACAVAMGLIAVAPMAARAQDGTTMVTSTTTTTMSAPTLVTGTVLRYYVDRSGFVTAMDVQTANGVEFVRFAPNMGARLYSTYPVGSSAQVYVTGNASRWDVVGVGAAAPTSPMAPYMISDVDYLDATPYIMPGADMVEVSGKLRDLVVNENGEVVGLILGGTSGMKVLRQTVAGEPRTMTTQSTDTDVDRTGNTTTTTTTTTTETVTTVPTTTITTAIPAEGILVRVPREVRHIAPGHAGTERVAPLFKGADVNVVGYVEAPRYGVLDVFENRISATALSVNGRSVGAIGIPMMRPEQRNTLFRNVNIGGEGQSAEEMRASRMGYAVYGTSTMAPTMTTNTTTTGSTLGDGTTMR
jgi:hypothetical protein